MMLPVMLDVKNKSVLIAGGGRVALRKARTFISEGAYVSVVSPSALPELLSENIKYINAVYSKEHIWGHFIVIAASNDRELNKRIMRDAHDAGILCMSVSDWERGDFISMAYERSGTVTAAVSTGGKNPSFSKAVRGQLKELSKKLMEQEENYV